MRKKTKLAILEVLKAEEFVKLSETMDAQYEYHMELKELYMRLGEDGVPEEHKANIQVALNAVHWKDDPAIVDKMIAASKLQAMTRFKKGDYAHE